jgi:hypothetical protein
MTDHLKTIRSALEAAGVAKLADGTYLDKHCQITMALTALDALEQAMQEQVELIVRGCCEAEKADPDRPDTICISVQDLTNVVECFSAPPAQQAQAEQQRYSPDGEGGMEFDSLGAWVKWKPKQAQAEAVPGHTLPYERALAELIEKIAPGLDSGDVLADAATASAAITPQQAEAVPQWVSCRCFDEAAKRLCADKGKCIRVEAFAAAPQPKEQSK